MIKRLIDKFIRLVYDDLKIFLVFFLLMQVGELYVDIRLSFLATIGFSIYAFLINGYLKSDKFQKFMPILGILSSFIITLTLYKDHTTVDKGVLTFYHLLIWLASARNLRERVMAKRTMMYVFLPVIVTTVILFAVYFTGVNLEIILGQIYPFLLMFYAVTFMLAVKMNLDQGYNTSNNRTINTINKRKNRVIYSVMPTLIIIVIFAFVLTRDYEVVQPIEPEMVEETVSETSGEVVVPPAEEEEEVVYKENKTSGKRQEGEDNSRKGWSFNLESKLLFRTVVEMLGLLGILYGLYRIFKTVYNKKIEVEEDEQLEVRESLLTKENIKKYLSNLKNKFKRKTKIELPRLRALYRNKVMEEVRKGKAFVPSDTPREFAGQVSSECFNTLTEAYENHRYGEKHYTKEEIDHLESKLNDK